jgi:hypothetical protein
LKKQKTSIKIGVEEIHLEVEQFETVDEGLERIGDKEALKLMNYAYRVNQLSKARKKFYATHPGPNFREKE